MSQCGEEEAVEPNSSDVKEPTTSTYTYVQYRDERDLNTVMDLVDNELSEPYSIFTLDEHKNKQRGYLAMLVVEKEYRSRGVGSHLVRLAINEMINKGAEEVALEAEVTNKGALKLYENLGFIRDKRLHRYYLSGADAFRLKLVLKSGLVYVPDGQQQAAGSEAAAVPG